jgi:hypothetical protein
MLRFVIYINLFKATNRNGIITCLLAHLHCYIHVSSDEMIYINVVLFCSEPGTAANVAPKKRRRKDASSSYLESNHLGPIDYFDIGDVPEKSSARGTVQTGKQLVSSNVSSYGQYHEDNRVVKNKISGPGGAPKRKSSEFSGDAAARAKIIKDVSHAPLELRDMEKHKAAALPVDYAHKSKISETFDYAYPAYRDKGTSGQLDFQQRKISRENQGPSNRTYRKEKHGTNEYPGIAMATAVYSTQTMVSISFSYSACGTRESSTQFNIFCFQHPVVGREGSGTKPKGTRLERAIRDLQKIVAECECFTVYPCCARAFLWTKLCWK